MEEETELVLIVDDDATTRLVTRLGLEQAGYQVIESADGKDALDLFASNPVSLIVLDLNMPTMDGFEACRHIRAMKAGTKIPILVMTGLDDDDSIQRAYDAGATDFIGKPFNPILLAQRVRYLLRKHHDTQRLAMNERMLSTAREISGLEMWEMDEDGRLRSKSSALDWLENQGDLSSNADLFLSRVPKQEQDDVRSAFSNLIREGKPFQLDHHLRLSGGDRIFRHKAETIDFQGKHRTFGTLLDITELVDAKDAALAAVRSKSSFLANMSHEIRTPMNGVLGMLELIVSDGLNPADADRVDIARSSAQALLSLLDDILDVSRIDAGRVDLEIIDIIPAEIVEDVCSVFYSTALSKNIDLRYEIDSKAYGAYKGDPTRLRQIVNNLVGNAIKFTHKGEVVVKIYPEDEKFTIAVTDTGIGVPADRRDRLFESFSQVDSSTTRIYGGSGLGLSITRKLVELMRGEIEVDSEPDVGSEFRVKLALTAVQQDSDAQSLKGKIIALEGFNETERESLTAQLHSFGATVENSAEADVLIQDAGLEQRGESSGLAGKIDRVLTVTNIDSNNDGVHGREELHRPIRRKLLLRLLKGETPEQLPTENNSALAGKVLLAEDNLVNIKVAEGVLNRLGLQYDVVNTGQEAVDAAREHLYNLVLMDCQMPEMDGYEATRNIRSNDNFKTPEDVPIIALTANAMPEDIARCFDAGMSAHLAKPFKLELAREIISELIA